jgi:predicted membrane protein
MSIWSRLRERARAALTKDVDCSFCCEPLTEKSKKENICDQCHRPVVREIDAHYERLVKDLDAKYRQMLIWGTGSLAVIGLIFTVLSVLTGGVLMTFGPPVGVLILIVHMVYSRLVIIRDPIRLFGLARSLFTRWLPRFSFIIIGSFGYPLITIPVANIFILPLVFVVLTSIVHFYVRRNLRLEKERAPISWWEKALLVVVAFVSISLLAVVLVAAVVLGYGIDMLINCASDPQACLDSVTSPFGSLE